jgi:hypothetical protein
VKFRQNVVGAEKYLEMYYELRGLKKLGRRGALSSDDQYLLWLPRATVVSAVSALDAYVHDVLGRDVAKILADDNSEISESLSTLVGRVVSAKKPEEVKNALRFIRAPVGAGLLAAEIRNKISRFEAYYAPEKVVSAFRVIGIKDILENAAARWQGPKTSRDDIAGRLDRYTKRRNQIAHEADVDTHGGPRAIAPEYASECMEFVKGLVERINLCLPA